MVKHIVMWKLSEACDKQAAGAEIKTALEGLTGKIPGLLACRVSPAYQGSYDLVLEAEFESAEAQGAYQVNPLHIACKKIVHTYDVDRAFADFEV
ncbi:MAG: Dabb family protein [Oscillospiraceae bacterium]|nr:Dabb family protein [Oscillospiraceae bacterium]